MGMIEVTAEIAIAAAPTDVAAVMFDPNRDRDWIDAVKNVEVLDAGIKPGARVRRTGRFLGRDVSWTTEVVSFHFPHALELRIAEGPFLGTVSYHVGRSAGGSTARIRTVGEAGAFSSIPPSLISGPMRSALNADLGRLKVLVEQGHVTR
jgi:hypothetical protein